MRTLPPKKGHLIGPMKEYCSFLAFVLLFRYTLVLGKGLVSHTKSRIPTRLFGFTSSREGPLSFWHLLAVGKTRAEK